MFGLVLTSGRTSSGDFQAFKRGEKRWLAGGEVLFEKSWSTTANRSTAPDQHPTMVDNAAVQHGPQEECLYNLVIVVTLINCV